MEKISFLNLKKINKKPLGKIHLKIKKQLFSGQYILDKNVRKFEKQFAKFNSSRFCVGVNSGHDALKIALKALGNIKDKKILVPGITFISTYMAISELGGIPIPIDIANDGVIDITKLPKKVDKKTVGLLTVNLYGNLCDYKYLKKYCKKNKIFLLEDSSQSHGSYFKTNKKVKFWGDAAIFSFYPGKNLGGLSDGGCVITNNKILHEKSLLLRNYGSSKKYIHEIIGYNSRLSSTNSIFLYEKLKTLEFENKTRMRQEEFYKKHLKQINQLKFLKRKNFVQSSHHIFLILVNNRDKLQKYLFKNNIETIIHYPIIPFDQKCYKNNKKFNLTQSRMFASKALSLPIGSHLSTAQQKKIILKIKSFFMTS